MNHLDGKNLSKEEALNLARKYNIGIGKDTESTNYREWKRL